MDLNLYLPYAVGLATAACTYALLLFLARYIPSPFSKVYRYWTIICLVSGVCGWWFVPVEGSYTQAEMAAWASRQQVLQRSPEWQKFHRAWYDLGKFCSNFAASPDDAEHEAELTARLEQSVAALAATEVSGLERRALMRLAQARINFHNGIEPVCNDIVREAYLAQMTDLESRLRLLAIVEEGQETDRIMWQQRVRMAKDLVIFNRLYSLEADRDGVYAATLPEQLKIEEIDFVTVDTFNRSMGLLLIEASSYMPYDDTPSGGTEASSAPVGDSSGDSGVKAKQAGNP